MSIFLECSVPGRVGEQPPQQQICFLCNCRKNPVGQGLINSGNFEVALYVQSPMNQQRYYGIRCTKTARAECLCLPRLLAQVQHVLLALSN